MPTISKINSMDVQLGEKKNLKSWHIQVTDINITNDEAMQIALSARNHHVLAYYFEREDTTFLVALSVLNKIKSYGRIFFKKEIQKSLALKAKLFFKDKKPSEILELANLIKSEIFWYYVDADGDVDNYVKTLPLECLNFEKYSGKILGKVSVNSNFLSYKEEKRLKASLVG